MFERFNSPARSSVVVAQEVARDQGHGQILPIHLLWGCMEVEGIASRILPKLWIEADDVLSAFPEKTEDKIPGHIPFTADAKKVLELALREALQMGNNWIGTEHILLGLARSETVELLNNTLSDLEVEGVRGQAALRRLVVKEQGQAEEPVLPEPGVIELETEPLVSVTLSFPVSEMVRVMGLLLETGLGVEIKLGN